tara:strand:- start:495 stop:638 length:144 start_codon:yes stop_codon:yes gene_type:complete
MPKSINDSVAIAPKRIDFVFFSKTKILARRTKRKRVVKRRCVGLNEK